MNHWTSTLRRVAAALSVAALWLPGAAVAQAETYPARQIRFIVPYAPGGTTDIIARLYTEQLARQLGQPVVVDNRPGAATNIAGQLLVAAEPNGYTLMLGTGQSVINAVLGPAPSFDAINGFTPVGMLAEIPFALAVDAKSPITNAKEFVASARGRDLAISNAQFDSQLKLLSRALAVPVLSIPYKGGAEAITAVLGGEVPAVLAAVPAMSSMLKAGKLRAVGVSSSRRVPTFADVPTFAEQGFPKFAITAWLSVVAPKGTPAPVVQRLSEATQAIARDPAFIERLATLGALAVAATPAETAARMKAEQDIWRPLAN
jgi:tripartite-type tricarboxylate transporter receptor subunit TctC